MKKLFMIFLAVSLAAAAISAQNPKRKKPARKSRPAAAKFVRERFDPKRDSSADLAAAIKRALAGNKRIILDVGGEWCGWCVYMDKFFFKHPALDKLRRENFVWVKVNMSPENENVAFLSAYPPISGYPHFFVLNAGGKLIHSQETSIFERGEVYIEAALTKFFNEWRPPERPKQGLGQTIPER